MMKIKTISKEIIKPSIPTPKHLHYHNLSLLDHVNGPILMPLIFFYSFDPSLNVSINAMLSRLKESLGTTLTIFYPLAGRIEGGNNVVCSDEGVPYIQTRVDCHLSDVVNKVEVSELDKLLPCKPDGPSELIAAIQVNVFRCGGIAIAVCMNHRIVDAYSILTFINSWSVIARGEEGSTKNCVLLCFDLAKLFPVTSCPSKFEFENEEAMAKRFMFDTTCIGALKTKYYNGRDNVSSGLILLAFIYSRIVSISKSHNVLYEVSQAVNVRSKINNSVVKERFCFGNLYVNAIAKPPVRDNMKDDICLEMVTLMQEATRRIDSDFLKKIRDGTQDLNFVTDHYQRAKNGEIVLIGFSNYSGLPVYESNFGWGKPVWVTSATLAMKNVIVLIPSLSGSQVDVYVCLSQEDMTKLECDQVFTSYAKRLASCSKL